MDKKHLDLLRKISEDVFSASLLLEAETKERDLLFYASQLIEMSIEIMEEKNNG